MSQGWAGRSKKMADTVEEISGGRLILGLGTGDVAAQHHAFGFPWEQRYGRLEEALVILGGLLRAGSVDVVGTHYQVRDCALLPRGPRPHGPPLLLGANRRPGPRMLRLAAQYADLWNVWLVFGRSAPDEVPPLQAAADAACQAAGRDPASLGRTVAVGVALAGHRLTYGPWDFGPGALTGAPEELAGALRAFAAAGIDHVQVYLVPNTAAGVEAFAPVLELLDRG